MAIYRIKRYSDDDEESHTGRNILLSAATAAAAIAAGRKGYLGKDALKYISLGISSIGNQLGSKSLVRNGIKGLIEAATKNIKDYDKLSKADKLDKFMEIEKSILKNNPEWRRTGGFKYGD